jgi:hypothetical protein
MSEKPDSPKDEVKKRRQAKLAAALKANIKRRKDAAKRNPAAKD